jgi:hypothetical protein
MIGQLPPDFDLSGLLDDTEWELDSTIVRAHVSAAGAPEKKTKPARG